MPDEQVQPQYVTVYDGNAIVEGVAQRTQSVTDAQTVSIDAKVDEQTKSLETKIETVGYESSNRTNEQLEDVASRAASSALLMMAETDETDETAAQVVEIDAEQYEQLTVALATSNALSLMSLCMASALVGVMLFKILTRGWQW